MDPSRQGSPFLFSSKEQERQCEHDDQHSPPVAIPLFHLHMRDLRYVARYFQSVLLGYPLFPEKELLSAGKARLIFPDLLGKDRHEGK